LKIVGIMPVRNEDWILGFSLRVALKWCDTVVVLAHACTDNSSRIACEVGAEHGRDRVFWYTDDDPNWTEMDHRQSMLLKARAYDATHIALIDADEVLTANLLLRIRDIVFGTPHGWMLDLPLYNLRQVQKSTVPLEWAQYHSNGIWGNRWVATAFLDDPKLNWQGDTFHHREPFGADWRGKRSRPIPQTDGGVLHFWGSSERRLRAKHALYRITERLKWPNKAAYEIEYGYDPATNPNSKMAQDLRIAGPWTFNAVKPEWLDGYGDLMQYLHIDREPWQEQEVRSLLETHGREKFAGLDLLGL
jgi:Glycosyl transferase family 2